MALNPPVNQDGQPMRVEGEYFAILRKDMEIEVKIEGWAKQSAKGKLFVTTARLVFVNSKHATDSFKSFDIPLLNIYDEKFEQPIFGANYLSLKVRPLYNLIPGDAKVKIWFMSGGCQKFLDIFLQILPQIRKRKNSGADPNFIKDLTTGKLNSKYAYVDPSDPTYVFVTQPHAEKPNSQFNAYYSKFPDAQPGVDYAPPASGSGATQTQAQTQGHSQPQPQGGQQQVQAQPSQATYVNYGQQQSAFGGQGLVIGTGEAATQNNQQYSGGYQQQNQQASQPSYPQFDNQAYNGQSGQQQYNQYNAQPYSNQQQYQPPPVYQQVQPQGQYQQVQPSGQYQQQVQPSGQYQGQGQPTYEQYQPQPYNPAPTQQQQQPQQPNAGYYYGFWGPQLQRNH